MSPADHHHKSSKSKKSPIKSLSNTNKKSPYIKTLSKNRRALRDYHVEQAFEVGIALLGSEVKPTRAGEMNLTGSYAVISLAGELILKGMHIKEYEESSYMRHESKRDRKLLAGRKEISKLNLKLKKGGLTLVPLEVYIKNRWIKISLAMVRGKQKKDIRQDIKQRDASRDIDRAMKSQRGDR